MRNDAVYVLLGDGVAAGGWLRERTLWKTEEQNTRRYKQTGEGGKGSQVPRANPGSHLELTESAFILICWQRFIFGAKFSQNARKRVNIPFFYM